MENQLRGHFFFDCREWKLFIEPLSNFVINFVGLCDIMHADCQVDIRMRCTNREEDGDQNNALEEDGQLNVMTSHNLCVINNK